MALDFTAGPGKSTLMTRSKYPSSSSEDVGVYALMTSSPLNLQECMHHHQTLPSSQVQQLSQRL